LLKGFYGIGRGSVVKWRRLRNWAIIKSVDAFLRKRKMVNDLNRKKKRADTNESRTGKF